VQNVHKNLAKMLQYGVKEDNQMCSTFYKHFMAFEYFPKNLEQEIEDKNGNKNHEFYAKYYSEPEVWYIIDALVSLTMSFRERGYHHGDIQPKNIFIDPHGFIKLCDNSLINYGRTGYLKMVFEPGYHAALSPQLLNAYKSKELHPNHDPVKSDIFSIGITCLCAALNTNIHHYYNFTGTPVLKQEVINQSYDKMSELGFSHQLISTIQGFLDVNEDRRTSLEEIYSFLAKYQEAIRRGQMTFGGQGVPPQGGAGFGASPVAGPMGAPGFPRPGAPVPGMMGPGQVPHYGAAPVPQPTFATSTFPGAQQVPGRMMAPAGPVPAYAAPGQRQLVDSRYP
jgi:serine/threonine protein kinase